MGRQLAEAAAEEACVMLEERFKTEGGIKERMHRVRTGYRSDQDNKVHEMEAIIAQQAQRIKELEFEITAEAKAFLAKEGYEPAFGARPLKRVIRQLIENPLAKLILEGKFVGAKLIRIALKDGKITFLKAKEQ